MSRTPEQVERRRLLAKQLAIINLPDANVDEVGAIRIGIETNEEWDLVNEIYDVKFDKTVSFEQTGNNHDPSSFCTLTERFATNYPDIYYEIYYHGYHGEEEMIVDDSLIKLGAKANEQFLALSTRS